MKNISLKLDQEIFEETEKLLEKIKTSRNEYINEAVEYYNQYQLSKLIERQLAMESQLVSNDSMQVLAEFEAMEDEIYAV